MKVLFLTVRADLGGGPEHLYQLLAHCPPDVTAYVACPDDKPYHDRFASLVTSERLIDLPHRAFSWSALRRVARFVREHDIDVLHSHGKGAGLYSRLLGLMTGRPVVHTFHGLHIGDYSPVKKAIYLTLERALSWMTRTAICVSQGEADLIAAAGFIPMTKVEVIENGIAIPPEVTRPDWTGGPLRLLAVNRYDHQKNPDLLIEIATKLAGRVDFHLDVIGTGERLGDIQTRVTETGLAGMVTLHGGVTNPRDYFRQAHVFVSTSRWEGMPLAVLEAMSEALCVLATDVVGNQDVIRTARNGLLFTTADQAADQLAALSPADWSTYAQEARTDAQARYSAQQMARRTFAVICAL